MNKQIEDQRDLITEKLRQEFTYEEIANIWTEINELVELEIKAEMECNR